MFQNPVEEKRVVVINACQICEHRHPSGCNWCDLDHSVAQNKPDPWAGWGSSKPKKNIASGEDAYAFS